MTQAIAALSTGVADFSLLQAFEALTDLYARVDGHAAQLAPGLDLLCHPGCSSCCRQSVWLTTLEALYVMNHMQQTLSATAVAATVARGVATFEAQRAAILAFGHVHCPGLPDANGLPAPVQRPLAQVRALQFDCPHLDDAGLCTVYPARELRSRVFAVSRLKSVNQYYACDMMGRHLDGRETTLMDAEAVNTLLHLYPLTAHEQVWPYYLWRYASFLA